LLLAVELLTFGGVQREVWLAAFFVAIAAFGCLFILQIARGRLDLPVFVAVATLPSLSPLLGAQFLASLLAGAWIWQACRTAPQRILRFFSVLIIVGLLEATLGLFQYFVQPGWILGYQNMFNRVSGTLINHNHYAGLLELLIFVPLGLA